jgi:hypothetical protein
LKAIEIGCSTYIPQAQPPLITRLSIVSQLIVSHHHHHQGDWSPAIYEVDSLAIPQLACEIAEPTYIFGLVRPSFGQKWLFDHLY